LVSIAAQSTQNQRFQVSLRELGATELGGYENLAFSCSVLCWPGWVTIHFGLPI